MRVKGLSVDGEHNIQELALGAEGREALQEAGAVARGREGTLEGPVLVGHAAGEQRWAGGSQASGPSGPWAGLAGL